MSASLILPEQETKIVNGIYYGQYDRTEELNERLYKRNLPDTHLENWFSPRPNNTKYARFPMIFRDKNENKNVIPPAYNTQVFAPTTRAPPFRGYSDNITIENSLRNQYYALQKSDQSVYVPSSKSDLFNVPEAVGYKAEQPHPLLFTPNIIPVEGALYNARHATANGRIGGDRFYNYTRNQLRGLNDNT